MAGGRGGEAGPAGERSMLVRFVLVVGLVALAAGAVYLISTMTSADEGDGESSIVVESRTPVATPPPAATEAPEPTAPPVTPSTPNPNAPAMEDMQAFLEQFGYPGEANVATVRIPLLGVEAHAGASAVTRGGSMAEPLGPAHALWYDLSAFEGLGGEPGAGGNAIFSGHVDYNGYVPYADIEYRGQAVFSGLASLGPGDIIEVDYAGQTLRYQVTWQESFSAAPGATDWTSIWRGTPGVDEITLYTCDGFFNTDTATYDDRVVVRAERI